MPGLRVHLLGRPRIEAAPGQMVAQPRGRKTWALLARVALADRPLTRRELTDLLCTEAADPAATLRWILADARRALGDRDLLRGDPIVLDTAVWVDVRRLEADPVGPGSDGTLLDGTDLKESPEFDAWLMLARAHCERRRREAARLCALRALAAGDAAAAVTAAEAGARDDPLDVEAQELYLRALVAAGRGRAADAHLAACERALARHGLPMPDGLRTAAAAGRSRAAGVSPDAAAAALLSAGVAAIAAGAVDGGVATLRRAAEDAERAHAPALLAEVLTELGSALVHAVRGADGEGAVVLHRALRVAEDAQHPLVAATALRELAFVDVQAGRHATAGALLDRAAAAARSERDVPAEAAVLALQGMNAADLGRHGTAVALLTASADAAASHARTRQQIWSLGVLARSLLLLGRVREATEAADASIGLARAHRWQAFLPWPQALRAELAAVAGDWRAAARQAEEAFALACELGDPCWEGMAARVLGLVAAHDGRHDDAWRWTVEGRTRCDRVTDRYVWVSAYVALGQLQVARRTDPATVPALAARLHELATRCDLPQFQGWALLHAAESGDRSVLPLLTTIADSVDDPALGRRVAAVAATPPR